MAGHVVHMGERRGVYRFWWGNLRERDQLGDPGIDGRIILRWIFPGSGMGVSGLKWNGGIWIGSNWLRLGTVGGRL